MRSAELAVRNAIASGVSFEFTELWGDYKRWFVKAQHDKCGFCEVFSLSHPGTVEHFAPKAKVQELRAPGRELKYLSNVEGRQTRDVCATGYWWLAYRWSNWLLSCDRCNSGWKRCLFPIAETRAGAPHEAGLETPLLLSPYGKDAPANHLVFSKLGQIGPRGGSAQGRATIDTVGLDRESLRRQRFHIAERTFGLIDRLLRAQATGDHVTARFSAEDLLALGRPSQAHAGMVRCIVLTELRQSWPQFESFKKQLATKPTSRRRSKKKRI